MITTQAGIEVTLCGTCTKVHPVTRSHCTVCGIASAFISPDGVCINHKGATC